MQEEQVATSEYLTFDLDEERYAIAVSSVEVVLEMAPITRVPKSLPYLRGVLNHRGSVIPVVDLKMVFGLGESALSPEQSIVVSQIVFEGETITVGLVTDEVQEVIDLDPASIEAAPSFGARVDSNFIKGIAKYRDHFIILLDLEKAIIEAGESEKE